MSNKQTAAYDRINRRYVYPLLVAVVGLSTAVNASAAEKKANAAGKPRTEAVATTGNNTIFWGVDKNGSVTLTDRPNLAASKDPAPRSSFVNVPGPSISSGQSGSATFAPSNDAAAMARAQREREYWREQAEKFQVRQRERERDLEETRRLRLLESQARIQDYYTVPIYARSAEYFAQRNAPYVAGFRTPSVYTSSPGAASAGGPAAFIGSGFATSSRR